MDELEAAIRRDIDRINEAGEPFAAAMRAAFTAAGAAILSAAESTLAEASRTLTAASEPR